MDNIYYNDKFDINWSDTTNAEPLNLEYLDNEKFTEIQVHVGDALNNMRPSFALDITKEDGGKNAISGRLDRAKEHFMSGEAMDHPVVSLNVFDQVEFTNGRHRTLAANQLGCEYIPMLVQNDNLEDFKKIIRTKDMSLPLDKATYDDLDNRLNLNWANQNDATGEAKNIFENNSHTLHQLKIESVFTHLSNKDEEDLYGKSGRSNELSDKVEDIKSSILSGKPLNFSSIGYDKKEDSVNLTTGKETLMAAFDLGLKVVPMLVDNEFLSEFKQFMEMKDMNTRLESISIDPIKNDKKSRENKLKHSKN